MKRIIGIMLILSILICCVSVLGEDALEMSDVPGMTAKGVLPIVTEPVTVTIGLVKQANTVNYDTNRFTAWLEEKTGVNIEFVYLPAEVTTQQQKVALMIASGEKLPDIITAGMGDDLNYYGENGYLIPLNDYFDKYGYWWQATMDKYVSEKDRELNNFFMHDTDGNIYGWPKVSITVGVECENAYYINKTWLDKLGLEIPKTTDELYTVLKAFKEQDPNGNGKADEIPCVGFKSFARRGDIVGYLLGAFTYYPYSWGQYVRYVVEEDDTVTSACTREAYREGLRYCKKLFDEGLLSELSFTQTDTELKALLMRPAAEDTIVGMFATHFSSGGVGFGASSKEYPKVMEYVALPPLTGPEGVRTWARWSPSFSQEIAITKDCEHPEVAFRLLDYLSDMEVSLNGSVGEEGVDWSWAAEGELDSNGNQALYHDLKAEAGITNNWAADSQNVIWRTVVPIISNERRTAVAVPSANPYIDYTEKTFIEAARQRDGLEPDKVYKTHKYTEEEQAVMDEYEGALYDKTNEYRNWFIIGEKDLDKDWDAYLSLLKDMHLQDCLDVATGCYKRMKSAIG